jgi:hypothetical protein
LPRTARRKEIYEELHPEARHGGDRKSSRQLGDLNDDRFTRETAAARERGGANTEFKKAT